MVLQVLLSPTIVATDAAVHRCVFNIQIISTLTLIMVLLLPQLQQSLSTFLNNINTNTTSTVPYSYCSIRHQEVERWFSFLFFFFGDSFPFKIALCNYCLRNPQLERNPSKGRPHIFHCFHSFAGNLDGFIRFILYPSPSSSNLFIHLHFLQG